jgi:hypothetical protein
MRSSLEANGIRTTKRLRGGKLPLPYGVITALRLLAGVALSSATAGDAHPHLPLAVRR